MRLALGLAALVLLPATGAAVPGDCERRAVAALAACVRDAAAALRRCTLAAGTPCAAHRRAARAGSRLRRKAIARCDAAAVGDTGGPQAFARRLERTCLNAAATLAAGAADGLGAEAPRRCLGKVMAASARLAVRALQETGGCDGCQTADVEARLAAAQARAQRAARRSCAPAAFPDPVVDGVLARARAASRCTALAALPAADTCAPTEADALVDLWRLAIPRPAGTRVAQVSSYDRSGGNTDFGIGPDTAALFAAIGAPPGLTLDHSYLYREGDRYVVFDERGPGVVWRIWMTGLDAFAAGGVLGGDLAFELDDEDVPRLQRTRAQLFSGTTPPFLAPLAGSFLTSSGGFFTALPIPFARRLRITTSTVPNWLQVTFSRLPPDHAVASFDPAADTSAVAARLAAAGDPSTSVPPARSEDVPVTVPPGATAPLWRGSGPGSVVRLELLAPGDVDVPVGLRLLAAFDDAQAPQVDAPLDDVFGASLGAGARGVAFGRDRGRYYSYFVMPFARAAAIALRNDGPAAFDGWVLRIGTVDAVPPGPPTHFHATAASVRHEPDGRDHVALDASGAGHVVGVVVTAGCGGAGRCQLATLPGADGSHLEGDERIAVDGSRWPQIHGTGLEDLFNGGFYFVAGPFTLATHGNPAQVAGGSPRRPGLNLRSAYRLFLGDAIPFASRLRLAIEHGPTNDVPAEVSSLVFWYGAAEPALAQSDRLAIGDAAAEASHRLEVEGRRDLLLTSAFRGDDSDAPVTATGMTATLTRLLLTVDAANRGVRLRRLADIGGGRQAARIAVDGAFAGIWQSADVNPLLRFAELDFELPAALTSGRGAVLVEIDARASPNPWTAFEYLAFGHR